MAIPTIKKNLLEYDKNFGFSCSTRARLFTFVWLTLLTFPPLFYKIYKLLTFSTLITIKIRSQAELNAARVCRDAFSLYLLS